MLYNSRTNDINTTRCELLLYQFYDKIVVKGFLMGKYIIVSLSLFIPFVSMAADHCTNPEDYTVDKRCYVTDYQKRAKPYNAVVGTIRYFEPYCTGTVIKWQDRLYVYTAKHCVVDENGVAADTIKIKTQSGEEIVVNKNKVGDNDVMSNNNNRAGDWAIYSVPAKYNIASTNFSAANGDIWWDLLQLVKYDARVIGYGSLKIMSDSEIELYKQKYIKYLTNKQHIPSALAKNNEKIYGFDGKGGINTYYDEKSNQYVANFLIDLASNDYAYYIDIFKNKELKVSYCKFSNTGQAIGCQIYGGNSGGGTFDNDGNLMGILTGYHSVIGGKNHAAAASGSSVINVNFLK